MARFGLNGYICEITPSEDGSSYELTVSHDNYDLTDSKTVAAEDLNPNWPVNSREQHEELFLPLIRDLEDKRFDLEAQAKHDAVDRETEQKRAERDAALEYQDSLTGEAEDGTGSEHSGEPEKPKKSKIKVEESPENEDLSTV